MNVGSLESNGYAMRAALDIERALRRTLNTPTFPATPEQAVTPAARRNPFWYRCMYMVAVLAEQRRWGDDWTRRRINSTLAITLEEEAVSALRYRRLARILKQSRWSFVQNRLELARFLERVEPEILVLTAGAFVAGEEPLTLPADAARRLDRRDSGPSRKALVERIRGALAAGNMSADLELADFLVAYSIRYIEMTPRGNYNLACYCSNGAGRASGELKRSRWIEAAAGYLFEGLSGLDPGMDAWAWVDFDLAALRSELGSDFDRLVRTAGSVRTARFTQ